MNKLNNLPLAFFINRPNYPWYVVGTVFIGAFMAALDTSIITVALPSIAHEFHQSISVTAWVALAYLLTLTALLAIFGRVADIVGRRPLYTLGFTVFIIGSAICGASPNLTILIIARILQAIGAVLLQSNSIAIVTAAVPLSSRGKAIGIQGTALAIGLSLGPTIGGFLIGTFGWRSIFYVNVPVGIIGTLLAAMILPRDILKKPDIKRPFDFVGAFLIAVSLVFLLFGINQGNERGWASPLIIISIVLGIVLILGFYLQEKRHPAPIIDFSLFKITNLTWGNLSGAITYAVMYGVLFIIPYYLEEALHLSSAHSGLLTSPLPLGMMMLAPIAGRIADRLGEKIPTMAGAILMLIGVFCLVFLTPTSSFILMIILLFIIGVGMGIFTPPNNSSVMGSTPHESLGVSSGMLNMSRSLGQSAGIALAFAIFQGITIIFGFTSNNAPIHVLVSAFHMTIISLAILSILAVLISIFRSSNSTRNDGEHHSQNMAEFTLE
jgi:EmrB/QacA subfamily drug resistance transporter